MRSGHQLAETLAEKVGAVERKRAGCQPVKGMIAIDDVAAGRWAAGEFDGGFDGFGAAVGEKDARKAVGSVAGQFFGDQTRQQAAIHPHQIRQIRIHHLLQNDLTFG